MGIGDILECDALKSSPFSKYCILTWNDTADDRFIDTELEFNRLIFS